jgi:hypothetical protein
MLLRRLLAGGPLAVLVAVLAHVAGFGFTHAPGTTHALDLAVALGSALATLVGVVVLRGFARGRGPRAQIVPVTLVRPWSTRFASVAELTGFAALAFVAIEALEGNLAFGGSLRAIIALVPIAMLVAWLAPHAGTTLREIGISLRAPLQTRGRDNVAPTSAHPSARVVATSHTAIARRRGRAPPLTA